MVCPLCKRSYCVDWKIDLQMQISAHVVKEGNSSESSALQLIYEEKNGGLYNNNCTVYFYNCIFVNFYIV